MGFEDCGCREKPGASALSVSHFSREEAAGRRVQALVFGTRRQTSCRSASGRTCAMKDRVYLITSGDLRLAANQHCWPAQKDLESRLAAAMSALGCELVRAFPVDSAKGHGFISSQR